MPPLYPLQQAWEGDRVLCKEDGNQLGIPREVASRGGKEAEGTKSSKLQQPCKGVFGPHF